MNTTKGHINSTTASTARTTDRVKVVTPDSGITPSAQKTARKSQTGIPTTENQTAAKEALYHAQQAHQAQAVPAESTAEVTFPLQAINYRRTTPDMLQAIEAQIRMPAARVTLLYLLVQLRIVQADPENMGEGATAAELTRDCPENDTMQVKRWVRHITAEATAAGLISKDNDYNTYQIQDAGHHYIRQACVTRLALWRVNPRMDAAAIHAIVASEESDHPLHYNQVIEIKDRDEAAPVPCKNSSAKRQSKSADHVYQSHQPLWAATMSWCRA